MGLIIIKIFDKNFIKKAAKKRQPKDTFLNYFI